MKLKYILPYWKITYESELSKDEILKRVVDSIEPLVFRRFSLFYGGSKWLEGKVEDNTFKLREIIIIQNSFLPWAKGEVIENQNTGKTEIKVIFKMPDLMTIILPISMIMWLVGNQYLPYFFLMMSIASIIAIGFGFHLKAYKLKNKLKEILKAEIKE